MGVIKLLKQQRLSVSWTAETQWSYVSHSHVFGVYKSLCTGSCVSKLKPSVSVWQSGADLRLRQRHESVLHDLPKQHQRLRWFGRGGRPSRGFGPVHGSAGARWAPSGKPTPSQQHLETLLWKLRRVRVGEFTDFRTGEQCCQDTYSSTFNSRNGKNIHSHFTKSKLCISWPYKTIMTHHRLLLFPHITFVPVHFLSPASWQNSQCVSGPSSMTQDCVGASARDPSGSFPPAYMSSLHRGYEELSPEQLERLQQDVNSIKNNYRRANVSDNNRQEDVKCS